MVSLESAAFVYQIHIYWFVISSILPHFRKSWNKSDFSDGLHCWQIS